MTFTLEAKSVETLFSHPPSPDPREEEEEKK